MKLKNSSSIISEKDGQSDSKLSVHRNLKQRHLSMIAIGGRYSAFIGVATEITAAAIVVQYWDTSTPIAIYITIFLVTICGINFLGVRWYGEAEFLFSFLKVSTIVGLIVLGIVLDLGGGPDHDRMGFRYWINPGPFAQLDDIAGPTGRFLAFWDMFIQASYAYSGTEVVALAAAEAENPRKTVPKAVKRVFYRILLFYLGGVLVIGLLVSSNDPMLLSAKGEGTGAASPFVIAVKRAGITVLPDIINAIILSSAYSSGNTALYAGSRVLYGLACEGMAPRVFVRCTRAGLPLWALVVTSSGGLLAFLRLNVNASLVFRWLSNISSVTGLCTWFTILLGYIRFYRAMRFQGVDRNTLPYRAPLQPYLSYLGITMISLVLIFNGFTVFIAGHWSSPGFVAAYITIPIYVLSFLYWKMTQKTKWVKIQKMDLKTGLAELEVIDAHYRNIEFIPRTPFEKFWDWRTRRFL
ncbi:hypothetical protein CROQUDRAFT_106890 [Cronartium quercuum f. sp. fusiforme G11]|uniref:Amino acid permease/ SLC12A domain-containing protein n=1 Tax=Cronartium quercuum f. sp. fusiforme G11 TaxID=708437 RepID=A0A9P6TCG7_9BASI|nr:hypothetical protein CROQUDRAFT_106890 [Cronartium quercuum f. sp. fusiforme G11]